MNEAFDKEVINLYEEPVLCHTTNHTLELIPNVTFHVLDLHHFYGFTLCLSRESLTV